ncbi:MAG: phosphatase PAP2 family protein [Deltaproteobacteria bacterium]|nr:phosphatase PAP2 family protein [Deltaproteobacteria bacterium]
MRPNYALWIGLVVIAISATLAAHYFPVFPGDVAVARWVQSLVPQDLGWAAGVSRTAQFPWVLLILALVLALSWNMAGWRGAVASVISLVGIMVLGNYILSPVIARQRPSPDLVRVFRPFSGYGFPSLSVLVFAATFGFLAILAAVKTSGWRRTCMLLGCLAILILGGVARIALGAHWPSDVIISYYLGLLWAAFLIRFFFSGSALRRSASRQDARM